MEFFWKQKSFKKSQNHVVNFIFEFLHIFVTFYYRMNVTNIPLLHETFFCSYVKVHIDRNKRSNKATNQFWSTFFLHLYKRFWNLNHICLCLSYFLLHYYLRYGKRTSRVEKIRFDGILHIYFIWNSHIFRHICCKIR